jgi:hypothetical protein
VVNSYISFCTYHYDLKQASVINDLLDFEALKSSNTANLSQVDVDAAVHGVVRMFTNSVRNKVSSKATNNVIYGRLSYIAIRHERLSRMR